MNIVAFLQIRLKSGQGLLHCNSEFHVGIVYGEVWIIYSHFFQSVCQQKS